MNAFPQYLKIRSNFQNDTKEEKRKGESAQVHYLDELVDVTTHELIRRHAREDLKIFNGESILCPRHRKASIVLNAARRVRAGFLLSLVGHVLLLQVWVIYSTKVIGEAILITSGTEVAGVIETPFSTTCTTLFPRWESGSFFLALILAYIS